MDDRCGEIKKKVNRRKNNNLRTKKNNWKQGRWKNINKGNWRINVGRKKQTTKENEENKRNEERNLQ